MLEIGIKSDPIETRYSFDWLFDVMAEAGIHTLQLGSFYELYALEDDYFRHLRAAAQEKGIRIKSVFTAHRELGGFFVGDPYMERAARRGFEKLIRVAGILGADYCGSNPGAVYRDRAQLKEEGIDVYLRHMRELMQLAREVGLKGLTMEPMSCLAEPPTTPAEMDYMVGSLNEYHHAHANHTVPVYLCGDISHGLVDANFNEIHSNIELFEHGLPMMAEFHFKNTDRHYNSTFGFSPDERKRGVVDLVQIKDILQRRQSDIPVDDFVGYLEIGGPKTGRDYSDPLLRQALLDSLAAIREVFPVSEAVS
jgi:ribulose-phosphate 3-epimerase